MSDWKKWVAYNVFWGVCPYCLENLKVARIIRNVHRRKIYYECPKCGREFFEEDKYIVEDAFCQYWVPINIGEVDS